jgi:hypothetical protein
MNTEPVQPETFERWVQRYQTEQMVTSRKLLQGILLVLILIGIPLVTFCLMFIADNA